jgi:hypothetical protein
MHSRLTPAMHTNFHAPKDPVVVPAPCMVGRPLAVEATTGALAAGDDSTVQTQGCAACAYGPAHGIDCTRCLEASL